MAGLISKDPVKTRPRCFLPATNLLEIIFFYFRAALPLVRAIRLSDAIVVAAVAVAAVVFCETGMLTYSFRLALFRCCSTGIEMLESCTESLLSLSALLRISSVGEDANGGGGGGRSS